MKQYRKPLLFALYSLIALVGFELGGYQYVLLTMGNELSLSGALMGSLASIQFAAIIIAPLVVGRISDKIGKKKVLVSALIIFAAGSIVMALAQGTAAVVVGIFVVGAGYSLMETFSNASFADNYPETANKHINRAQVFFSVGAVVSPLVVSEIMKAGGSWRSLFIIMAVLAAVLMVPLLFSKFTMPSEIEASESRLPIKKILLTPLLILPAITIFLVAGVENGAGFFTDSLFVKVLNAPESGAFAVSLVWLMSIPSRFIASLIKKRHSVMLITCLMLATLSLVAVYFARDVVAGLIAIGVMGFAFGPLWGMLFAMVAKANPGNTGVVSSVMMAGTGLGGMLSPIIMGAISQSFSVGEAFLIVAAAEAVACVIFAVIMVKSRKVTAQIAIEQ